MRLLKGQVLVELLLAFAVSSVALVGMAQIATKSLANATYSANRSEANKYAVQAIEWVRHRRTLVPWSFFVGSFSGIYPAGCDVTSDPALSTYFLNPGHCAASTLDDPNFSRTITFTPSGGNQQTVSITVSWSDNIGTQNSTQTIVFKQY